MSLLYALSNIKVKIPIRIPPNAVETVEAGAFLPAFMAEDGNRQCEHFLFIQRFALLYIVSGGAHKNMHSSLKSNYLLLLSEQQQLLQLLLAGVHATHAK